MRLPRFILSPLAYKHERQEVLRLRRELRQTRAERDAWRDKFLIKANATPLFTPPPKPVEPQSMPPVGLTAKRAMLAAQRGPVNIPTAEEILAAAERRNGNS